MGTLGKILATTGDHLKVAAGGSLVLAALYACGFFVHLGDSYLLGVYLPTDSPREYLTLGGTFLFKTLEALLEVLLWIFRLRSAPAWPGEDSLPVYPVVLVVLLLGLLATRRIRRLDTTREILSIVLAGIFACFWLSVLKAPYRYHGLLFPLSSETADARRADFRSIDAAPASTAEQKRHQKRRLLGRTLDRELADRKLRGDGTFDEWRRWQNGPSAQRTVGYGVFVLTVILSLGHLLWAMSRLVVRGVSPANSRQILRYGCRLLAALYGLVVVFQLCSLPLTFGILLRNRTFLSGEVVQSDAPGLTGQRVLLLGERAGRVYLYSPEDLWTLHVVSSSAVKELRIDSRESALSWIDTLHPGDPPR